MIPTDHVPKTCRDRDRDRRADEIERRRGMFRQARNVSAALRTVTERQRDGGLTRAQGVILSLMIRQNLRACVRRERLYRPTRAGLARESGYSEKTVSRAIAALKKAGIIVAARYENGGRLGDGGKGLSTEFRSGCLQFLADQLRTLGFRLGKSLERDLRSIAAWAAAQVGETTGTRTDRAPGPKPTGTLSPATMRLTDRARPSTPGDAPVEIEEGPPGRTPAPPAGLGWAGFDMPRPPLSRLASRAATFAKHGKQGILQ